MKIVMKPANKLMSSGAVVALIIWFSAFPTPAAAQGSPGQDAVYNPLGTIVGSSSFVDASQFVNTNNPNICSAIYSILQPPTYAAAVIDARGISGATALTCAPGFTPWNNGTTTVSVPSTILLPATGGSAAITIPSTWKLPPNTHLIGEGDSILSTGLTTGTTILAQNNFTTGTAGFSQCSIQRGAWRLYARPLPSEQTNSFGFPRKAMSAGKDSAVAREKSSTARTRGAREIGRS